MTRFAAVAAGWLIVMAFAIGPSESTAFPTTDPVEPTAEQRRELEDLKNRASNALERYEHCREREAAARERARHFARLGDWELAAAWRRAADAWRRAAEAWRETERVIRLWLVDRVDAHFNLEAPPGTSYEYDPNSRSAAFVPRQGTTKDSKRVIFCPNAFEHCITWLASVKLHELRHAWQVHNCWSEQEGFWGDCTFWGHLAELDAYGQMELAHDAGTIVLPDWIKDHVRRKIREHLRGVLRNLNFGIFFQLDQLVVLPGTERQAVLTVVNSTSEPRDFVIEVADDLGWDIFPPDVVELSLGPEEVQHLEIMVAVPPDATAGANRIQVFDHSLDSPLPMDTLYMVVVPHVRVHVNDAPLFSGAPGTEAVWELVLTSPRPSTDPVDVTLEFSNTEGWDMQAGNGGLPASKSVVNVTVSEDDPAVVIGSILLDTPPVAEYSAAIIEVTAIPDGDLDAAVTAQFPVTIEQLDLGPVGFEFPPPGLPVAGESTPIFLDVINSGGWAVDSFFDITFEVRGPDEDGPVVYEERQTAEVPEPGEVITVEFPAATFPEPGIYTATIVAPAPLADKQDTGVPDSDPDNDELILTFEVLEAPTAVDQWGIF